jgi:hypothetical protein
VRAAECPVAACRGMGDKNMNDKRKDKIVVLTVMGRIDGSSKKVERGRDMDKKKERVKEYGQRR